MIKALRAFFEFLKELLSFVKKEKESKSISDVKVKKQEEVTRKDDNERLVDKASSNDKIALEEIRRRLGE